MTGHTRNPVRVQSSQITDTEEDSEVVSLVRSHDKLCATVSATDKQVAMTQALQGREGVPGRYSIPRILLTVSQALA